MKTNKKYLALIIVLTLVIGVVLTGCGSQSGSGDTSKTGQTGQTAQTPQKPQKPSEYLVAIAMPLTGASAGFGVDFVNGFMAGVEDVNKAGGIDGVPIKVVKEDTLGTAEGGVNAFNKLVQVQKAPVVVVSYSSVVKAMAALAAQANVLVMNNGANAPDLSGISPNEINAFPLSTVDVVAMANYLYKDAGKKNAGVLYLNNATGIGAAKLFKEVFETAGGKVVSYQSVEPNAMDVSTQVTKLKQANPDVVYVQVLEGELGTVIKKVKEMGITAPMVTYQIGENATVRKATQENSNGLIYAAMAGGNPDAIKVFADRFQKDYGHPANGLSYVLYNYDTAFLIKEAISYMNSKGMAYDGPNLRKAILEKKSFDLPLTGKMVFDSKGDINKTVNIKTIKDWSKVDTDEVLATIEAK